MDNPDLHLSPQFIIMSRMNVQVMWLTFALFHLSVAVAGLFLLWWFQIPPDRIAKSLASIPGLLSVQWLGILGLTGVGILALYVRLWRKLYAKATTPYYFRGLTEI